MWQSIRNIVCACVFMSMCVGGDWQFQQMCSMRWQHDIYFACSIWHVWMLLCILSRCEVIARRWAASLEPLPVVSPTSISKRLPYKQGKKQHERRTEIPCHLFCFNFHFLILVPLIDWEHWTNTKRTSIFSFCQNLDLTLWHNTTSQFHQDLLCIYSSFKETAQRAPGGRLYRLSIN